MTLGELITKALADHQIGLQFLSANITNASVAKNKQTRLTFMTTDINPTQVLNGTGPVGIVLWIPKDVYDTLSQQPDAPPQAEAFSSDMSETCRNCGCQEIGR